MKKIVLNNFSGQINTDTRTPSTVDFRYSENFDLSRNDVLFPMKGQVSMSADSVGDGTGNKFFLTDFIYGNFGTGIGENVLAYGVQSGQATGGKPELYKISDALAGTTWATALTTTGQATLNRATSTSYGNFNNLFHLYKGYLYFAVSDSSISRIGNLETSGQGATWSETWRTSFTHYSVAQAITHSKDDYMYIPYNVDITTSGPGTAKGYIMQYTGSGTPTNEAFTCPNGYVITSICESGDYIAIALRPAFKTGSSRVLLWNRNTSSTLATENIDWGEGDLNVLDNIDGHLIGISLVYNSSFNLNPRIVVKEWSGGTVNVINTIYLSTAFAPVLSTKKWKQDNNLYFGLKASLNGTRNAIFRVGKNKRGQFVVVGDTSVNNNVSVTTIDGFAKIGDVWYLAYDSGSVNRTRTASGYGAYGVWNSLINPSMDIKDRPSLKQLVSVQCDYEAIPSGGSVIVKFGVDDGTLTNVISDSTAGSTSATMQVYADGTEFTSGKDFEFEIRSTGTVIKSLTYVYKVLDTNIELYG